MQRNRKKFRSQKTKKNAPRVCDIDIIDYGKIKLNKDIILPHPECTTEILFFYHCLK